MKTFNNYMFDHIAENQIDEAFQSQTLRDIAAFAKAQCNATFAKQLQYAISKNYDTPVWAEYDKLVFPRGIAWDKIPEDDIVFGMSNDPAFYNRPEITNKNWISVWIDINGLNTYISCGNNVYTYRVSGSRHDSKHKSYWDVNAELIPGAAMSVKKSLLYSGARVTNKYFVITINKKTILKYNTADLIRARKEAQAGMLGTDDEVRAANHKRYQEKLTELAKNNKNIKKYTDIVVDAIKAYKETEADVNDITARVRKLNNTPITTMLSKNGITDSDYINLFFGFKPDSIPDDTPNSSNARWDFDNLKCKMDLAKDNITRMMGQIKDLSDIFETPEAFGDDKEEILYIHKKLENYKDNVLNYISDAKKLIDSMNDWFAKNNISESLDEGIFSNLGIDDDINTKLIEQYFADDNVKALKNIIDSKDYLEYAKLRLTYRTDDDSLGVANIHTLNELIAIYLNRVKSDLYKIINNANKIDYSNCSDPSFFANLIQFPNYYFTFIISPDTIGCDPVDFNKCPIKFQARNIGGGGINVIITGFKNLRSLEGLIDFDGTINLFIWDCPRLTNIKGVKTAKICDLFFFPEAKDNVSLGKTPLRKMSIIAPVGKAPHCRFATYTGDNTYDSKFKTANDRSKTDDHSVNQTDKPKKTVAPVSSRDKSDDLPVLYKHDKFIYADPAHTTIVGSLTNNGTVYRYRNGVRTTCHWMDYNDAEQILYTVKGKPAYKVML